ncbi:MAG: HesA/MoeB/ThiF family protein, partial [Oceanobacter sp.]
MNGRPFVAGRTWVSGSAIGMAGHVTNFDPRIEDAPCYASLYPNDIQNPQHCSENGVLAPITGIIGTLQALEAIKLLNLDGQSSGFY